MSSIQKRGDKWRVFVHVDGKHYSKTFRLKKEAVEWANEQEEHGRLDSHTFKELCGKYKPIIDARTNNRSELNKLKNIQKRATFIDLPIEYITKKMIVNYRDARLLEVGTTTVAKDLTIMSAMFKFAINELEWLRDSPMKGVDFPIEPPPRRRGVRQEEIDAIVGELNKNKNSVPVGQMFLLSIETGMRQGEMLALRWAEVREKALTLLQTKNGDKRDVPLSIRAREIIDQRRNIDPVKVFPMAPQYATTAFCRARNKTPYKDVRFHDARSEAVTRLSKKLDIMQLAKVIGHRDPKSLMFYYAETADEMADRL